MCLHIMQTQFLQIRAYFFWQLHVAFVQVSAQSAQAARLAQTREQQQPRLKQAQHTVSANIK